MKRAWLILIIVVLILAAASVILLTVGGSKYSSHYSAVGYVHSNSAKTARMSFSSLRGTQTFKLKSETNGQIRYTASLEAGSATVYYDCGDGKTQLFSIGPGQTLEAVGGQIPKGTVYLIVETDGTCKHGSFQFELEEADG